MTYAYGHRPDSDPWSDPHIQVLIGAPTSSDLPDELDQRKNLDRVLDQWRSESCVSQVASSQDLILCRSAGEPTARMSPKFLWDVGRMIESGGKLENVGVTPRSVYAGAIRYGMVAEDKWPLLFDDDGNPTNANEPPPWDMFAAGADARAGGYYRVSDGPYAPLQIKKSISTGACVAFALDVTKAFEDYDQTDDVWSGDPYENSDILGSHMLLAMGWRKDGAILVLNSWGTGWGHGGFMWIDPRYLASSACRDKIVRTRDLTK